MTDSDAAFADIEPDIAVSFALRGGGHLGLGEDAVYVARDDETLRVDAGDIVEVQQNDVDWFHAILSVVLVGFGLWATTRNVLGGLAFSAAGVASLYVTYRKRGTLTFQVQGRAKPLKLYPERSEEAYEALRPLMDTA